MLTADAEHLVVDEVMKRRLVVDGEGAGDEGRITDAIKSFLIWCKGDDRSVSYKTLNRQLARIKHDNASTHSAILLHEQTAEDYCFKNEKFKQEVEQAKEQVEDVRKSLQKVRERQQNGQECHALFKLIMTKPERSDSEGRKIIFEEQVNTLQKERDALDAILERLTIRAKDFFTAGQSLLNQFDEEYQEYADATLVSIPMDIDDEFTISETACPDPKPCDMDLVTA